MFPTTRPARLAIPLWQLAGFVAVLAVGIGLVAAGYALSQFAGDVCLLVGGAGLLLYCFQCGRWRMGGGGLIAYVFIAIGAAEIYSALMWAFLVYYRVEVLDGRDVQWQLFSAAYQFLEWVMKVAAVAAILAGTRLAPRASPDGAASDSR